MAFITAKDLTLGYDAQVVAKDISFSVSGGDYLCIVGENGSGKTTLMRTILHQKEPISGKVETGDGLKKNFFLRGFRLSETDFLMWHLGRCPLQLYCS